MRLTGFKGRIEPFILHDDNDNEVIDKWLNDWEENEYPLYRFFDENEIIETKYEIRKGTWKWQREEWRENLLTKKEREEIFDIPQEKKYEMRRRYLLNDFENKTRIYYETKTKEEDTKEIGKAKNLSKFEYEVFTYRPLDDKRISQEQKEKAHSRFIGEFIELKNNFANCPFHNERTPSFHVRENKFYCFGCGEKGDVISFIMKLKGLDFIGAVKFLL